MSFIFTYKRPLCFLIFVYSISKTLSKGNNDLNLYSKDSIRTFINSNGLTGSKDTNGARLCIRKRLFPKMNNRTNIKSYEDGNQYCIEYDNEDDSNIIKNPELRYKEAKKLKSKTEEWIKQMQNEQLQPVDNYCDKYTGDKCVYIKGADEDTQLKLPLPSLQGYCEGEQPIKWFEDTIITCSLVQSTKTSVTGTITITEINSIEVNITDDAGKKITDDTITITGGTIIKAQSTEESETPGESKRSENTEDNITGGTITITNGANINGNIIVTNGEITITNNVFNDTTINKITITDATITDAAITNQKNVNIENLINCCNGNNNVTIGNATVTGKSESLDNITNEIGVDIWVNNKGEITNNSTVSCRSITNTVSKYTIKVTFSIGE